MRHNVYATVLDVLVTKLSVIKQLKHIVTSTYHSKQAKDVNEKNDECEKIIYWDESGFFFVISPFVHKNSCKYVKQKKTLLCTVVVRFFC